MASDSEPVPTSSTIQAARYAQETISRLKHLPPKRRVKGRVLAHIPNEIYLEIFDHLLSSNEFSEEEAKAILTSLIPVCHLFRTLCLPRRIRHLKITSAQKNHVNFVDSIKKYPYPVFGIRKYVCALTFSEWMPDQDDDENMWIYTQLLSKYALAFDSFSNLSTLALDRIPITRDFWDKMAYMPVLENVSITRCTFKPFEKASDPLPVEAPIKPWTSLVFTHNGYCADYVDALATLAGSEHLVTLKAGTWNVAHAVLSHSPEFPTLISLSTPIPTTTTFLGQFLSRTPSIESLSLPSCQHYHHILDAPNLHLPEDALPNLKSLQCPSSFLNQFVPGRPVGVLDITTPMRLSTANPGLLDQDNVPVIDLHAVLSKSETPLQSLAVTMTSILHCEPPRMTWLDNLVSLTLYVGQEELSEERLQTITSNLQVSAHTNIRTVSVLGHPLHRELSVLTCHLRLQDLYIRLWLSRAFPNATFSFNRRIEWRRQAGDVWTPIVIDKRTVKAFLTALAQPPHDDNLYPVSWEAHDYGGCLKSLFQEEELTDRLRTILGIEEE